jgi:hypothetical protein
MQKSHWRLVSQVSICAEGGKRENKKKQANFTQFPTSKRPWGVLLAGICSWFKVKSSQRIRQIE